MLIYEIPGQFRIVYVHGNCAGARGYHGNVSRGVVPICESEQNHEAAKAVVTPLYVQYRSPEWRRDMPWQHVPMSLELFEAFIDSTENDIKLLERSARRCGICPQLLATLAAAPREEISQNLKHAVAAALHTTPWKEAHTYSPGPNRVVWACILDDSRTAQEYKVSRLVYSGYAWFYETGELAVAPDYFAEIASADAPASVEGSSAPTPPPVRVFPWRPWV